MANKNRNLIVAYYPTAEAADTAATQLKHWDKDEKDIKLGGMGILTLEDGKLKTHKVGARAAGTGAKWGTILGATGGLATGILVATGVLTGGLGLIPGAIVGALAGTGAGALFHKKIGMDDSDRQRIHDHLAGGGAALAVMADDFEVEPTKAEIAALGGDVEHYTIPDDMLNEFEETRQSVEDVHEAVAKDLSGYPMDTQQRVAEMLVVAPALTTAAAVKLHEAGVDEPEELQAKAATIEGRKELAEVAGVDHDVVQDWAHSIDLTRIPGLGPKYLKLLNAAGIETAEELADYDADDLMGLLLTVNEEDHLVGHLPSAESVAYWVEQAREMPPYLRAIKVTKDMLDQDAYSWHASGGDDPRKIRADAILFNRKEGYEVRLMIQKVCNTFGFETVEDVKKVESVIANDLPGNIRGREKVYNWLVDYFTA